MRERLLRLTLVLMAVAWLLSFIFRGTEAGDVMLGGAITLTILAAAIALVSERRLGGALPRPALAEHDLAVLRQAIQENRDVSFVYRARDGSTTSRRVTPVELFDVGEEDDGDVHGASGQVLGVRC